MNGDDHLLATVHFSGHPNVKATNRMTLEITKEDFLTPQGDCIIGILSDTSCAELAPNVKAHLARDGSAVLFEIQVQGERFVFTAYGSSSLSLLHPLSMVIRRSTYTCWRTLAIKSTAAACDLPRSMVKRLVAGAEGTLNLYKAF
jgi:hypothetical protein